MLKVLYSRYRNVKICFYSCSYQNRKFFHSCRSCGTGVTLVSHLTCVVCVALASHLCCSCRIIVARCRTCVARVLHSCCKLDQIYKYAQYFHQKREILIILTFLIDQQQINTKFVRNHGIHLLDTSKSILGHSFVNWLNILFAK